MEDDDIQETIAAAQSDRDAWNDYLDRFYADEMPQFTSGGVGVNYAVRNGRIVFA